MSLLSFLVATYARVKASKEVQCRRRRNRMSAEAQGTVLKVQRWPSGQISYRYQDHLGQVHEKKITLSPGDAAG